MKLSVMFKKCRVESTYRLIALTFFVLIMSGALLLMLPKASVTGESLRFIDALFTATSASCVTGLVVVDTGTYFSTFGQMIVILLIQLGGLGIMTFATLFSIAFGKKINLQDRLRIQESLNQDEITGVVRMILKVVKYTFCIEAFFGTIMAVYFYQGMGLKGIYWGYWHAVSAFCNAGFDLMGNYDSLVNYVGDWTINLSITSLITLGSIGFAVMEDVLAKRNFRDLRLHSKIAIVTTLALTIIGTLVIRWTEAGNVDTIANLTEGEKMLASYFQSITPRTAGFNTVPLDKLRPATAFLMVIWMMIGASPGGTGGGIKTTTFAVAVLAVWNMLHNRFEVVAFQRSVDKSVIYRSFMIIVLAVLWVCTATFLIACFEQRNFLAFLFEVASAFATVGLSMGETRSICDASKIVLILTMFAGRVGILTFAMALTNRHPESNIKYPKGKIAIG